MAHSPGGRRCCEPVIRRSASWSSPTTPTRRLAKVLDRIPQGFREQITEVIVSDDHSNDATYLVGLGYQQTVADLPLTVIRQPTNLGYGGNQKSGYRLAIEHDLDIVVLLHGDGQYAPELLPDMVQPLIDGRADAVFGSRMLLKGAARKGGMPLYKFIGNRTLTTLQNALVGTNLSEFHPGTAPTHGCAADHRLRGQLRRLRLRHRDHPAAPRRRPQDRRDPDPDLLRRRDLLRQRDEVRARRAQARPRLPLGACLASTPASADDRRLSVQGVDEQLARADPAVDRGARGLEGARRRLCRGRPRGRCCANRVTTSWASMSTRSTV